MVISVKPLLSIVMVASVLFGCATFRKLGENVAFIESVYTVSALIENPQRLPNVYGIIVEWDGQQVRSADFCRVGEVGLFGFIVERPENQFLLAFSDQNGNERYDPTDPAWFHGDEGVLRSIPFDRETRKARLSGRLSRTTPIPTALLDAARLFKGTRTAKEAATGWSIPVALGDIAKLDEERFAAVRGAQGLWEPARFPMEQGIGIFFLEPYTPRKIPVLFVYGAAGSPQDWRTFFEKIDRDRYQPWFYFFPSGRDLESLANALNYGVTILHNHYGFRRLHVVAHSMGGLISRGFLVEHLLEDGQSTVDTFVTISTPWGGHEAAEMGVRYAPSVVPSWRDMQVGSRYQQTVFSRRLRDQVDHFLPYGTQSSRSFILPGENDGTVSVTSQTAPAAVADAALTKSYRADHVGILKREDVIEDVQRFLDGELRD